MLVLTARTAGADGAAAVNALRELSLRDGRPTALAAPLLPFLLDLVSAEPAPHRASVLVLLADVAAGGRHLRLLLGGAPASDALRAPLEAEGTLLTDLVSASDPKVRGSALLAAAVVARPASALHQAVRERADEESHGVPQGMALLALGAIARRAGPDDSAWDEDAARCTRALGAKGPLKTLPALAFVASGRELPAAATAQLLAALAESARKVNGLPLNRGDLRGAAIWALATPRVAAADTAKVLALFAVARTHKLATDVGCVLVRLAFGDTAAAEPLSSDALTPIQRELLLALSRTPAREFAHVTELNRALERVGLPFKGPRLDRLLGLHGLAPADALVDGRPLWLWCRLALMGRVSADDFVSAVAGLGEEAVAVLLDLGTAPFGLHCRWPQPRELTREQTAEDAAALFDLLARGASALSRSDLQARFTDQARAAEASRSEP